MAGLSKIKIPVPWTRIVNFVMELSGQLYAPAAFTFVEIVVIGGIAGQA
jgi:hypothetical protein